MTSSFGQEFWNPSLNIDGGPPVSTENDSKVEGALEDLLTPRGKSQHSFLEILELLVGGKKIPHQQSQDFN